MSIKEDIKGLRAKQYKVIVATLWKVACAVRPRVTQFWFQEKNVHPEVVKNPKNPPQILKKLEIHFF